MHLVRTYTWTGPGVTASLPGRDPGWKGEDDLLFGSLGPDTSGLGLFTFACYLISVFFTVLILQYYSMYIMIILYYYEVWIWGFSSFECEVSF